MSNRLENFQRETNRLEGFGTATIEQPEFSWEPLPIKDSDYIATQNLDIADDLEIPLIYAEEISDTLFNNQQTYERPGIIKRIAYGFFNKAFIQPFKNIQKYSTLGELDTQMEALSELQRIKQQEGREVSSDEIPQIFEKAKATVEKRIQGQLPQLQLPEAKGAIEKGAEIFTGVTAFVTRLAIARRFVGTGGAGAEIMSFEMVNLADNGTPGMGILLASSLGLAGKIPATTTIGKVGKTAAQGGVLAGITAMEGGSPEDIAVAFILPGVLRTLGEFPNLIKGKTERQLIKELSKTTMKGFDKKHIRNAAKSFVDADKVTQGKMSPKQWGIKHGKNLNDIRTKYNKAVDNVNKQTQALTKAKLVPKESAKAKIPKGKIVSKPQITPQKQPWEMTQVEVSSKKAEKVFPLEGKVEVVNEKPVYTYRTRLNWDDEEKIFEIQTKNPLTGVQQAERLHKKVIQQALTEGKPVPPEVLAEYPELAEAGKEPTTKKRISNKEINKQLALDQARIKEIIVPKKGSVYRTYIKDFEGEYNLVGEYNTLTKARKAIIPAQQKQLEQLRAKRLSKEPTPKITEKEGKDNFAIYKENMPNATEKEIVVAMAEDGLKPPRELIEKYKELPVIDKILEQEQIDKVVKRAAEQQKQKTEIPPRPLVNPKASALRQDEQLRKQQAWDKKYGKPVSKGKPTAEPITKEEENQLRAIGYSVPDILKMDRTEARKKITANYVKHIDNPKHEAGFIKVPIPESVQETAQRAAERTKIATTNIKNDIDKFRFYPKAPPEFRNAVRTDLIGALNKARKNVYEHAQDAIWGGMNKEDIQKSVEILYARDQLSRTKLGKGNPEINLEQSQDILDSAMENASPEAIAAADRYRKIMDSYTNKLIERGILEEGQQIQDYVRHYVEDYTPEWAPYANIPTRLKRPFRGYTKEAKGTTKEYRQDQESLLASLMEMEHHNLVEDFIETQVKKYDIKPKMPREQRIKLFGSDARGYAKTPRPGRIYIVDGKRYRAYTPDIPFSRAIYMTEYGEAALGSFKNVSLIPEEMYNTFRDFSERGGRAIYLINRATGYWKSMAILSHFPSFNVNNLVGDTWMSMIQHPKPLSLLSEIETALRYLSGRYEGGYFKELEDFISKHDIKQTFSHTEIMAARNSKNPVGWLLNKARDVSDYRESIMRVAYASSLLKAEQAGEGAKMVEAHNWIDTEGLSTEDALGKISREVLIDYAAQSKTFRRFIRGGVAPFGTWYFKASKTLWNWYTKHPFKATLAFMSLPIVAAAYNNRDEKTQELESQLPDFIRNRVHFVLGENEDGTVRTLSLQLPQDVLIGTKIFSIVTDYGNRVINGEMEAKEAAVETLKTWGIREYEGAKYLLTPFIRIYSGLKTGKDPYDKSPVYRREYERLTPMEKVRDTAFYIFKTCVPFLGGSIQAYEKGLPQDVAMRKLIDSLAGKGALGIYDINKKGQVVIEDKNGKKTTFEFADIEKIRKLAIQEYKYLGQIEDAWVATDLEIEDFIKSEMVIEPLAKIYDQYAKRIDIPSDINNKKKARIISEILKTRLINRITLPRIKQKRLQVQISRAKTSEQKRKLAEEYKKTQQERLEEVFKQLPSTARDIQTVSQIKKFLEE